MNTKEKLLGLLENNTEKYLSGEDIAETLSISRTAVWKAVNALRSDGCLTGDHTGGCVLHEHRDRVEALLRGEKGEGA